ncbi:MAG: PQQ-dependent sugar dehydrogenase, partial [Candidatus Eisenbacteria bacterium]
MNPAPVARPRQWTARAHPLLPVVLLALGFIRPGGVRAAVVLPPDFSASVVASGLSRPVNFDFLPDGRILLVEQVTGRIRLVVPGAAVQPAPVGTVSDVRSTFPDQGLLGIAIDPRWPAKPYVYVHHASASSPNIKIARYAVWGDLEHSGAGALWLDSLSRRDVLGDLPDDNPLHDGGTIEFGPDGLLYIALGDDAIGCSAQDIHQMRGKILRLEVRNIPDGPGPILPYAQLVPPGNPYFDDTDPRARLVWHFGLRNPWTFDFEPYTGVMAIADVGENAWEEIQVTSEAGRNFGWPVFEGMDVHFTDCGKVNLSKLSFPDYAYGRDSTEMATCILGGICHRAEDVAESFPPEYWGQVFFLDFFDGRLRRLAPSGDSWV